MEALDLVEGPLASESGSQGLPGSPAPLYCCRDTGAGFRVQVTSSKRIQALAHPGHRVMWHTHYSDTHILLLRVKSSHQGCTLFSLEGSGERFLIHSLPGGKEGSQQFSEGEGAPGPAPLCNLLAVRLVLRTEPQCSHLETWDHKGAVGAS